MRIVQRYKLNNFFSCFERYFTKSTMSNNNCTVAVCQLTSRNNKDENLQSVKKLVSEAATKNAKVVFLPEGCDYLGNNKEEIEELAESLDGPLMQEYKLLAKSKNVWLSIGGFHEAVKRSTLNQTKLNNCHVIINNEGNIVSVYRKLHLFDVSIPERNINLKESDNVIGGTEIVSPVNTPAGPIGLSICYDIRFPELSTLLRKKGASILTFPSAFTNSTGQLHWEILLRARAIENQCYVVAAAQYGRHNEKRVSYGQAMVVDPWGKIIAECPKYSSDVPSNESIAIAEINGDVITKIRTDMPVLQHRRDDIYCLSEVCNLFVDPKSRSVYMFADKVIPPSTVFYCTKHSFAFTNIKCVVPGHVLVSSLRPVKRLEDLTQDEIADLFQAVVKVQKVLESIHSSTSSTICVQDGQLAGQTVPQVHCHILPRQLGDFERNDDVYQRLANHDRDNSDNVRNIAEMSEEANILRELLYK